jgi:BTB/POZ domain
MMASIPDIPQFGLAKCVLTPSWYRRANLLTDTSSTRFLDCARFSDFTIVCDGYEFKVHKVILCADSHYFERLCTGSFRVGQHFWCFFEDQIG